MAFWLYKSEPFKWSWEMQKAKGDDFVVDTRFNCERTFDEVAQASFDKVKVNAVTIGKGR